MGWREPTYAGEFPSLGWDLVEWYRTYLRIPSGPMVGRPFELTDEQASFIINFYRIDPRTGARFYRRGVLRRPKGWGKSPLLAGYAIGSLVGPSVFDGWDANGEPVGRPHLSPWVQIAACSEDQTDNTYVALMEMLRESPAVDEFAIDVGLTRVFLTGRAGRIEPVTASSGSREGQPVTDAVLDETHLWVPTNKGTKLAATIRRNVAKMDGTSLESTNAFVPGDNSVAERSESTKGKGQRGLLLDVGPRIEMDAGDLRKPTKAKGLLAKAYSDSALFVDLNRIYEDATDADTEPEDALRYYWNIIVQGHSRAFDPKKWAELANPELDVPDGTQITLGFKGSRFHDSTALVGTTVADGHQFLVGVWEASAGVEISESEVDEVVRSVFSRLDVWRMYADPPYWESAIDHWEALYPDQVVRWWTNRQKAMAYALKSYVTAMRAAEFTHDGDEQLAQHISNARRRDFPAARDEEGRLLWTIGKEFESSPNTISAAVAGCLSWEARGDAIAAGEGGGRDYLL